MNKILLFLGILFLSQSCVSANGLQNYCKVDCDKSQSTCSDVVDKSKSESDLKTVNKSYVSKKVVTRNISETGNKSDGFRIELMDEKESDSINLKMSGFNKMVDQIFENGKKIHDSVMKDLDKFEKDDDSFSITIPEIKLPSFSFDLKTDVDETKVFDIGSIKNEKIYLYWVYDDRDDKRVSDRENELLIKDRVKQILSVNSNKIVGDPSDATAVISLELKEDDKKLDDGKIDYSAKFILKFSKGKNKRSFSSSSKVVTVDLQKDRDEFKNRIYKQLEKELNKKGKK